MKTPSLRERLLSKAVINWETGCWEWTASRDRGGYGRMGVEGRHRKAHRVAYELIEGPIPDGLVLDHLCRVTHCINPAHLEPVTDRENILRSLCPPALNARKTHCNEGHEYTAENTRIRPGGGRACRECARIRARRFHEANRELCNSRRSKRGKAATARKRAAAGP